MGLTMSLAPYILCVIEHSMERHLTLQQEGRTTTIYMYIYGKWFLQEKKKGGKHLTEHSKYAWDILNDIERVFCFNLLPAV